MRAAPGQGEKFLVARERGEKFWTRPKGGKIFWTHCDGVQKHLRLDLDFWIIFFLEFYGFWGILNV